MFPACIARQSEQLEDAADSGEIAPTFIRTGGEIELEPSPCKLPGGYDFCVGALKLTDCDTFGQWLAWVSCDSESNKSTPTLLYAHPNP
jgi:hypothetical protein